MGEGLSPYLASPRARVGSDGWGSACASGALHLTPVDLGGVPSCQTGTLTAPQMTSEWFNRAGNQRSG